MADPSPTAPDVRIPAGAVLVHIGPSKTGTTALQAALFAARPELEGQGVHHAGATPNPARAVQALTGRRTAYSEKPPSMREWRGLAADVRGALPKRVIVSSEMLANADPEQIRQVVSDFGVERVHVVITLRPLSKILPSVWQQNVKDGIRMGQGRWLKDHFPQEAAPAPGALWHNHRHDALARRWAAAVGPDRVTVVVLDDAEREGVLRVFERLLGLRERTLALQPAITNRSMTAEEIEAIRHFNIAWLDAGYDRALHARVMRYGATRYLSRRQPGPGQQRIRLPEWSLGPIREATTAAVDGLAASGVRVVGDLDRLREVPAAQGRPDLKPAVVPEEVGARLATGVIVAAGRARVRRDADPTETPLAEALAGTATRQLVLALATRARTVTLRGAPRVAAPARPLAPSEARAVEAIRVELATVGLTDARYGSLVDGAAAALSRSPAPGEEPAEGVSVTVAAALAVGVVEAMGLTRRSVLGRLLPPPLAEPIEIARVPTRTLVRTLGRRLVGR